MAALEERAKKLAGMTLDRLTFRLSKTWKLWGGDDFPKDNGIKFRNEMFLFANWMLYIFRHAFSEQPLAGSEWILRNAGTFFKLTDEDFMRCIGVAQLHMRAFWTWRHIENYRMSTHHDSPMRQTLLAYGRQLDWIYTMYNLDEEVAQGSYQIVIKHAGDSEGYHEASREYLGLTLSQTPLGWNEASSPEYWDHWACAADMSAFGELDENPVEAYRMCERVFSEF